MLNVPTSAPTVALSLYSHIYTQIDASEYNHRTPGPFMNRINVMMSRLVFWGACFPARGQITQGARPAHREKIIVTSLDYIGPPPSLPFRQHHASIVQSSRWTTNAMTSTLITRIGMMMSRHVVYGRMVSCAPAEPPQASQPAHPRQKHS